MTATKPPTTIAEHHREKAFEALGHATGMPDHVKAKALVSIAHSLASLSRDVATIREQTRKQGGEDYFSTGPG